MAELLRGAPVAKAMTEDLARRSDRLMQAGVVPTLAIVRVGERADDLSYERGALKRAESCGVRVVVHTLKEDCSQEELEATITDINGDGSVHGCLIFRPLPAQLDEARACALLSPAKDVDAVTAGSLYGVFAGAEVGFAPCTAEAVLAVLDHYGVELCGADVTVVGRSLVIGKPVSMLLLARNATVTMCHTRTRDLAAHCREADVLVVCVGHARTVGLGHVREGQVVIDVGINWNEEEKRLVGDVDEAVHEVVSAITPVPGGIGAVTTAVLMSHVVRAAERTVA